VRLGLIGLGEIAVRAHVPAILRHPEAELVAIADLDETRLEAAPVGTERTTSADELLADPRIDAVIVATPPHATSGLAAAALQAGKYVLAEKPLAPTSAEAAPIAAVPGAAERLQIGLTYRHHPAVERLRTIVQAGDLGAPLLVQVSLCDEPATPQSDPAAHERRLRSLERTAPVVSDGVHACDRLLYVLGEGPVDVSGWSVRTDPGFASPNVNGGVLTYADGSIARIEVVWLTPELPPSQFAVTGPLGHASLAPPTFALDVRYSDGRRETHPPPGDKTEVCFDRQLAVFLGHVRAGTPPVPGLAEALASLDLAERIALAGRALPGVAA